MEHRQDTVYNTIARHPGSSNQDLAVILGWSINRITPRTRELLDAGMIQVTGTKKTIFGRDARIYEIKEADA